MTVSGGDSIFMFEAEAESMGVYYPVSPVNEFDLSELVEEMKLNNELVRDLVDMKETESISIWEKPLEDYTVSESLSLLSFLVVCAVVVFVAIGGIIKCKL